MGPRQCSGGLARGRSVALNCIASKVKFAGAGAEEYVLPGTSASRPSTSSGSKVLFGRNGHDPDYAHFARAAEA